MKISLTAYNYSQINYPSTKQNITFGHHPELEVMLSKKWPVLTSSYFRRGSSYIDSTRSFLEIVNIFHKVFKNTDEIPKMLIVGIGNSEEPFSYLSTIKQLNKDKPVDDVSDFYIVDMQSKPKREDLYITSYCTEDYIPFYAKEGFVFDPHPKIPLYDYRVKDELFEFLCKTYDNPAKSKWETKIQDAINTYPENYFDIVSINNVLYYIKDYELAKDTFNQVCRTVKPSGSRRT